MIKDRLRRVEVSDERPAAGSRRSGVTVTVSELDRMFRSLNADEAAQDLALIFALYLRQYPAIDIIYDGTRIDPRAAEDATASYTLPPISAAGENLSLALEIVEWRIQTQRRLYFCDMDGFPLDDTTPGVHAPGFNFTAYLKSDYFAKLLANNLLDLATMDPAVEQALTVAKAAIRDHFRRRAAEKAAGLVKEWQTAGVYPYKEEPQGPVQEAERQVFNVVALHVNHDLPEFSTADDRTKQFQMRLLRQSIERAPADLSKILNEVLDLPVEKRQELAELLDRTTLAAMIGASKIVSDRLDFIRGLDTLVFDEEFRERVRELYTVA